MLVTSTVLFLGFALWTGSEWIRGVLARGSRRAALRQRARSNTQFLLGFLAVLALFYAAYIWAH
jgi:putative copper export protein